MSFYNNFKISRQTVSTETTSVMPSTSRKIDYRLVLLILLSFVLAGTATAQDNVENTAPTPPIEMSEIPARATTVSASLNQSRELLGRAELLDEIEQDFAQREVAVARNLVALRNSVAAAASRDALGELEQEWQESDRILKNWDDDLRRIAAILEKEIERLDSSAEVWREHHCRGTEIRCGAGVTGVSARNIGFN